jgi:hypothetical protein
VRKTDFRQGVVAGFALGKDSTAKYWQVNLSDVRLSWQVGVHQATALHQDLGDHHNEVQGQSRMMLGTPTERQYNLLTSIIYVSMLSIKVVKVSIYQLVLVFCIDVMTFAHRSMNFRKWRAPTRLLHNIVRDRFASPTIVN